MTPDSILSSAFASAPQSFVNNGLIDLTSINGGGSDARMDVRDRKSVVEGEGVGLSGGNGINIELHGDRHDQGAIGAQQPIESSSRTVQPIARGTPHVLANL